MPFETQIENMKVGDAPASIMQHAMVVLFGRACRIAVGTTETLSEAKARTVQQNAPPIPGPNLSKVVKYRERLQQGVETEAPALTEKVVMEGYSRYRSIFGVWPSRDENITDDQLSCLYHAISSGSLPWADFTVFGPHGHRIMMKLRMSGRRHTKGDIYSTLSFPAAPALALPTVGLGSGCS